MIAQQQGRVQYVQFGHFLQFPNLVHGIFTRLGGCSEAPFWGLNVSFTTGDNIEHVKRNRLLALSALQLDAYPCASLWLVHGAEVVVVDEQPWEWRFDQPFVTLAEEQKVLLRTAHPRWKADAFITRRRDISLAIASADCVPVMLYDPVQEAIGLVHAGWRGTARGIAAITVDAMREQFGSRPEHIYAGIGPSIGPCCYEISEEVQGYFLSRIEFDLQPTAVEYRNLVRESAVFAIKEHAHRRSLMLDLWETNRNQLLMAGLLPEHIELPGICTSCEKDRFYSHRAEHGKAGRFPSIIALRDAA
ncbi:MAG TPA: peptidoglycan editing factor PgeF [Ktedonobacteraceae bacterium]|nr:peptidoglycan editing factor PgeF [Ktedonobacteraceae bacterium]